MRTPGTAQEALVDTAEEQLHLFGLVVAERRVDGDEIAVLRFETKILTLEIAQALAEQSGGGKQNQRHRGLRDHQRFLRDGTAARTERLLPRRASTGSTCEVIQAGATPKSIPVSTETASVKSRTGQEGDASTGT